MLEGKHKNLFRLLHVKIWPPEFLRKNWREDDFGIPVFQFSEPMMLDQFKSNQLAAQYLASMISGGYR